VYTKEHRNLIDNQQRIKRISQQLCWIEFKIILIGEFKAVIGGTIQEPETFPPEFERLWRLGG
jgi:hypothetical protein